MILSEIIEAKRKSLKNAKSIVGLDILKSKISGNHIKIRDFKHAIGNQHDISLIAEVKKASPTRGVIREDFNPVQIAEAYQINGAAAISVLTEEDYFQGRLEYIKAVKDSCSLPVLRKDFIFDEYQVYESLVAGADALLLIADILSVKEIKTLYSLAKSLGLSVLCEAHSEEDIEKILSTKAEIIGINNRDLHTFKLRIETTQNLMSLIPKGKIIVSESGIRSHSDALFLKSLGVNAVLVGEVFMDAPDIGAKVREFTGRQINGNG